MITFATKEIGRMCFVSPKESILLTRPGILKQKIVNRVQLNWLESVTVIFLVKQFCKIFRQLSKHKSILSCFESFVLNVSLDFVCFNVVLSLRAHDFYVTTLQLSRDYNTSFVYKICMNNNMMLLFGETLQYRMLTVILVKCYKLILQPKTLQAHVQ